MKIIKLNKRYSNLFLLVVFFYSRPDINNQKTEISSALHFLKNDDLLEEIKTNNILHNNKEPSLILPINDNDNDNNYIYFQYYIYCINQGLGEKGFKNLITKDKNALQKFATHQNTQKLFLFNSQFISQKITFYKLCIDFIDNKYVKLNTQLEELQKTYQKTEKINQEYQNVINKNINLIEENIKKKQEIEKNINNIMQQIEDQKNEINNIEKCIISFNEQITTTNSQINQLRLTKDNFLDSQLNPLNDSIKKLENEIAQYTADNSSLENKKTTLKDYQERLKKNIKDLSQENLIYEIILKKINNQETCENITALYNQNKKTISSQENNLKIAQDEYTIIEANYEKNNLKLQDLDSKYSYSLKLKEKDLESIKQMDKKLSILEKEKNNFLQESYILQEKIKNILIQSKKLDEDRDNFNKNKDKINDTISLLQKSNQEKKLQIINNQNTKKEYESQLITYKKQITSLLTTKTKFETEIKYLKQNNIAQENIENELINFLNKNNNKICIFYDTDPLLLVNNDKTGKTILIFSPDNKNIVYNKEENEKIKLLLKKILPSITKKNKINNIKFTNFIFPLNLSDNLLNFCNSLKEKIEKNSENYTELSNVYQKINTILLPLLTLKETSLKTKEFLLNLMTHYNKSAISYNNKVNSNKNIKFYNLSLIDTRESNIKKLYDNLLKKLDLLSNKIDSCSEDIRKNYNKIPVNNPQFKKTLLDLIEKVKKYNTEAKIYNLNLIPENFKLPLFDGEEPIMKIIEWQKNKKSKN